MTKFFTLYFSHFKFTNSFSDYKNLAPTLPGRSEMNNKFINIKNLKNYGKYQL